MQPVQETSHYKNTEELPEDQMDTFTSLLDQKDIPRTLELQLHGHQDRTNRAIRVSHSYDGP